MRAFNKLSDCVANLNKAAIVPENDDVCHVCADGGSLVCCERCPRSFHAECHAQKFGQ